LGLKRNISGISAFVGTLFCLLLVINFRGLIPFSFARRRQGWFRIVLRRRFFVVRLVVFFLRGKIAFVTHLVPTGSPVGLGLILFWIEIISTLIRPLTLVLRLCANITAGHVILGLISRFFVQSLFLPTGLTLILLGCGVVFFLFEAFVAFIQRLVFSLLLISYLDEAN
jgi:F-type H+-transporting ATPase subunit a